MDKLQSEIINLSLTKEEALVLFEFLNRFNDNDSKLTIEDQAEERVLWNLCSDLERNLVESFQQNYDEILAKARETMRDKND